MKGREGTEWGGRGKRGRVMECSAGRKEGRKE